MAPARAPARAAAAAALAGAVLLALAAARGALPLGAAPLWPLERWALAMLGLALLAFAGSAAAGAPRAGRLAGLYLAGSAGALWLTEPHWFPQPRLRPGGAADLAALGLVLLMGLAGAAALLAARPGAFVRDARAAFGAGPILLVLALSAGFAVSVMGFLGRGPGLAAFAVNLAAAALLLGAALLCLLAFARALPPPAPEGAAAGRALARLLGHPLPPALVALAAALLTGRLALEGVPHVEDEVAYLFQARTLAEGALWAPAPPEALRPFLDYYLLEIAGDRWFAVTAPGWPAALALGVLAGAPWLVNPVLAGLSVWLAHAVAGRLAGPLRAGLVAWMMAASPWLAGMAGSLMTHVLCLFLLLLAWRLLLGGPGTGQGGGTAVAAALGAGLAMGWLFLARPLEGLLAGGLTGLWLLRGAWRGERGPAAVVAYGLGCLAAGGLVFPFNLALTGDALLTPLGDYLARTWAGQGSNAFGFGPGIGPPGGWGRLDLAPGHSPLEGFVNTLNNLNALHLELGGWAAGSLLLVWVRLAAGDWRGPRAAADRAMAGLALAVILVHAGYWFAGSFYVGPRYWFLAFFPLVFLSAGGAETVVGRLGGAAAPGGRAALGAVALLCLGGLLVFGSWRAVAKYPGYGNYAGGLAAQAAAGAFGAAVVQVAPGPNPGVALALNDPWLRPGRPVFVPARARSTEEADPALLAAAFPGRPLLRVELAPVPERRRPR